jgi:hypothetical protein
MKTLRFTIERTLISERRDITYITDDDDVFQTLRDAMWDGVHLDVHITIDGVTVPAMMWEDPEHWADDWAEMLGIDHEDVVDTVAGLLVEAMVES